MSTDAERLVAETRFFHRAAWKKRVVAELLRLRQVELEREQERLNTQRVVAALVEAMERVQAENAALRCGEFICQRCGLRKDAEQSGAVPF